MKGWLIYVYQHAQGGKRLQEAGCRPEQGEAEAEEEQSNATITYTHTRTHTQVLRYIPVQGHNSIHFTLPWR